MLQSMVLEGNSEHACYTTGDWQIGQLSALEYAHKARRWAKALKLISPQVQLVSCGKEGNDEVSIPLLPLTRVAIVLPLPNQGDRSGIGLFYVNWWTLSTFIQYISIASRRYTSLSIFLIQYVDSRKSLHLY